MTRPLRILRVIARLNIGGPAIQAISLTRAFQGPDRESLLVCGDVEPHEGDMAYLAEVQGVRPWKIQGLGREISPVNDLRVLVRLLRIVARFRPRILHTHTAKAGTLGRTAGILWNALHTSKARVRLVHTFHGHVFHSYFGRVKTRVFLEIERSLARFTHRIVVISPAQKEDICRRFRIAPPEKVTVLPLGFDLEPFARLEEARPAEDPDFRVGLVGRLAPVKNHRMLLQAAVRLRAEGRVPPVRFAIVGDGELRDDLEQETGTLGLSNAVAFQGWQRDMAAVYAGLDAVVLTSLNEGTPVTLIEAMAAARPVVATAVGGVPDLLGDALEDLGRGVARTERGLRVPSGDDRALAHALAYLQDHPEERRALGRRARAWAVSTFGMERLVNDLEALYRGLT